MVRIEEMHYIFNFEVSFLICTDGTGTGTIVDFDLGCFSLISIGVLLLRRILAVI